MHAIIHHLLVAASTYSIPHNGITPTGTSTIGQGIQNVIKILLIVIGMLSIIFVVAGGLQMTLSSGNAARVKQGRETVIYAVVGLVFAIGAYALVTFITSRIGN